MKLLKLKLRNFKGIKEFELDTQGGCNVVAYGDNATGKTTLADAFMWLLFDKDSNNRKDFEIKTLGPDGEPEHGLEHEVEAVLDIDGKKLTLRKVFYEKWTKKRGSATEEFTGHTTDYFIDGVPVQKKEYEARIAEIADEQIFRLLTDPRYFNEILHWQKRRELLLQVCGDVSDEEVIASKKALDGLSKILGNRTIEQQRKIIQCRLSEINKELQKIPVRIDEAKLNLPDISDITNEKELPNDIAKLRKEIKEKQEELAQARAGGQVAEKTKELRAIEAQILDLKNKHKQSLDEKVGNKSRELSYTQSEIYKLKAYINAKNDTIKYNETSIKSLDEKIEKLRNEWYEENGKVFEQGQAAFLKLDTCPTCGQPLPQERLQEAREKARAQFNKVKSEKLEAISTEGKKIKDMKAAMEENLAYVRSELEKATAEIADLEKKEAALKEEINDILQGAQPVESTPEYIQFAQQHKDLQEEIQKIQTDNNMVVAAIQKEIDTLGNAITALERAAVRLEARKNGLKRIEELKAEERRLAAEYEELERQLYLTEEFIRAKVRLLEDRINSRFQMAKFKLFDVQINGAIVECCETVYNGVPYSNLNNGARLNIGLDIINALSEHYSFAPPVWLDNAESVVDILPTKGQQIRLIVSGSDKKLRVEITDNKNKNIIKEAV